MGLGKKRGPKSLAVGRPPTTKHPQSISRKATRGLINSHHALAKKRARAIETGDQDAAATASAAISALGGLEKYQQASLQGQRTERGGDTSKVLLDWVKPAMLERTSSLPWKARMLEIGALSTMNACSVSGLFEMQHIDLHSQAPGIQEQDFMERPLPADDSERFDIVSLSLVLNFVPTPAGRGEMLRRTRCFLQRKPQAAASAEALFPSVFIVLPKPCLSNSRYFSNERFRQLMESLGFRKMRDKATQKLVYSLWTLGDSTEGPDGHFPKREVHPGANRNNFSITLNGTEE